MNYQASYTSVCKGPTTPDECRELNLDTALNQANILEADPGISYDLINKILCITVELPINTKEKWLLKGNTTYPTGCVAP